MRVVVAEDTLFTREGIVHLLRDAGIDVVAEAENAEQLLAQVRRSQPHAAVIDIRMPPTHTDEGLVAAQRIRVEYQLRSTPPSSFLLQVRTTTFIESCWGRREGDKQSARIDFAILLHTRKGDCIRAEFP